MSQVFSVFESATMLLHLIWPGHPPFIPACADLNSVHQILVAFEHAHSVSSVMAHSALIVASRPAVRASAFLKLQVFKMAYSAEPVRKAPYSLDLRWRVVWQRLSFELSYRDIYSQTLVHCHKYSPPDIQKI